MKSIKVCLLVLISLFMGFMCDSKVYAVEIEEIDYYGVYCSYQDVNNNYYDLVLHADYRESNMSLETDDFAAILGEYVDDSMSDEIVIKKFLEIGLYTENGNGNYQWSCPIDSSKLGIPGLNLVAKGCYEGNCDTSVTPSAYESYTCNYVGQTSDGNLNISYVSNNQYVNGKWDITYPDGTNKTFIGTQINGNFMPDSKCEDIYYIASEKRIKVALNANDGINNNVTLSGLCDSYDANEIEHFCSGPCTYPEMSCSSSDYDNGCPKILAPAFRIIKRILMPIVKIGIPIVLILLGTIDLVRAVMASDDKVISEATSRFIKRCLAAIIVFFVVTIVSAIMNMFSATDIGAQNDWKACWNLED